MKSYIFFLLLLLPFCSIASDFKFSDIPMKDGHPYYELTIPAGKSNKNELFHQAQLFLAEYFKKTVPEIKIEDKEDGILVARVGFAYNYLVNPNILHGRCECLLHFKLEDGKCSVSIYDFALYHQVITSGSPVSAVSTHVSWERQDDIATCKKASENERQAVAELKSVNEHIQKLIDALMKKLAA